jgi:hypothetical protein
MANRSQLIIFLKTDSTVLVEDFSLLIDEQPIDFEIVNDQLIVEVDLTIGVHLLKLCSRSNKRIGFVDVQLNRSSVRHGLYLSYLETASKKIQPCTEVWEPSQTWVLPFANPISYWIQCMSDNVPQHMFGQDLQKNYNISYPSKKINIPDTFSNVVKDFFAYDFDFFVAPAQQTNLRNQAVIPLNLDLTNADNIIKEYQSVKHLFYKTNSFTKNQSQNQYNTLESKHWKPGDWYYAALYSFDKDEKTYKYNLPKDSVPIIWEQINQWGIQDYVRVNIICLEPGGYAAPHKDPSIRLETGNDNYDGCCQLYIPLNIPDGNYIKLAGVGIIDTSRANAINITDILHCAVNHSSQPRYVLAIRCNIEKNTHLIDQLFLDKLS